MTLNGAIMQLVEMRENSMMPMVFKPYFDKVIETISECEEPHSQPRKGKWIRTRTMTHDGELYCDQCEQEHPEQKIIWNFCPNCGCRMEEGDADEVN